MSPEIQAFFEPVTHSLSYVVRDPSTLACAIIDPVLDYEARSARIQTRSAGAIASYVREQGLSVQWILETHAHADHLSAAQWLRHELGGRVAIGEHIRGVRARFAALFGLPAESRDGQAEFDQLFTDSELFHIGNLPVTVMATPGHTPACVSYRVGDDAVFVGDTLFMPDYGTARADFPGGDARTLFHSIRRLLELPPHTRLFMCHDYRPGGREARWETTVEQQRTLNVWVKDGVSELEFVTRRRLRDSELDVPELILPALQVNIRAGHLPTAEANGIRYLKIPLNQLGARG